MFHRHFKQAGQQPDDGGQNNLVKISYCKESFSCIIHRMKSIQLEEDNAWLYDSLVYQGALIFNDLDKSLRDERSLLKFKEK